MTYLTCSGSACPRAQRATRQPSASSAPPANRPGLVANRSQARPCGWSLLGFQACRPQQPADRMAGPPCHPSKAADTSSNPCRVAPVTHRPPVGSGTEQPVAPPVQARGSSRPAGAPVPGTRGVDAAVVGVGLGPRGEEGVGRGADGCTPPDGRGGGTSAVVSGPTTAYRRTSPWTASTKRATSAAQRSSH